MNRPLATLAVLTAILIPGVGFAQSAATDQEAKPKGEKSSPEFGEIVVVKIADHVHALRHVKVKEIAGRNFLVGQAFPFPKATDVDPPQVALQWEEVEAFTIYESEEAYQHHIRLQRMAADPDLERREREQERLRRKGYLLDEGEDDRDRPADPDEFDGREEQDMRRLQLRVELQSAEAELIATQNRMNELLTRAKDLQSKAVAVDLQAKVEVDEAAADKLRAELELLRAADAAMREEVQVTSRLANEIAERLQNLRREFIRLESENQDRR